jgi:hypothetical protein
MLQHLFRGVRGASDVETTAAQVFITEGEQAARTQLTTHPNFVRAPQAWTRGEK